MTFVDRMLAPGIWRPNLTGRMAKYIGMRLKNYIPKINRMQLNPLQSAKAVDRVARHAIRIMFKLFINRYRCTILFYLAANEESGHK